jgi:hypothetical protein|tara:strand:- start:166 stop:705 length:540 start_codon:yes stop_codon:yes gene_type:complete
MVNNKTYNNVVNTLLYMAENHKQIFATSVGDIWDIDLAKNTKFALFHINPTSVTTGDSTLTYNFQIFIMDMVDEKANWTENNASANFSKLYKTLSNEQDVFNETLQICTDFIGMLRHSRRQSTDADINSPVYFTDDQFTIEPFQERFDNLCCGWVFNLGVLVQNDFQTCEIPQQMSAGY